MCGFIAQFVLIMLSQIKNKVASMLRLIQHRGPDSSEYNYI